MIGYRCSLGLVSLVILSGLLAACGGGDDDGTGPATTTTAGVDSGGSPTAALSATRPASPSAASSPVTVAPGPFTPKRLAFTLTLQMPEGWAVEVDEPRVLILRHKASGGTLLVAGFNRDDLDVREKAFASISGVTVREGPKVNIGGIETLSQDFTASSRSTLTAIPSTERSLVLEPGRTSRLARLNARDDAWVFVIDAPSAQFAEFVTTLQAMLKNARLF